MSVQADCWEGRPWPLPDAVARPFFDAAGCGRLQLQRCVTCGTAVFYPRPYCTVCLGGLQWIEACGKGCIYTFTVIRQNLSRAWRGQVPYVVVMVELPEGVRMMGNLVGCPADEVHIGMPVEALFVSSSVWTGGETAGSGEPTSDRAGRPARGLVLWHPIPG
ncbi:MAG: Zn-ribbon domain-containing OB-fold protein [Acidimicrobiales bacterium]